MEIVEDRRENGRVGAFFFSFPLFPLLHTATFTPPFFSPIKHLIMNYHSALQVEGELLNLNLLSFLPPSPKTF